jgi:ribosomal-protein-alanine N-acetyltransferase
VTIRDATEADLPAIERLYREFVLEVPPPSYEEWNWETERREITEIVSGAVALVAESDGEVGGFALARLKGPRNAYLADLYVVPSARRAGVARALMTAAVARLRERGAEAMTLNVSASNAGARAFYDRLGFELDSLYLASGLEDLERRLAAPAADGVSYGSVHVQTDDRTAVERLVAKYVPRLGRSAGTEISEPRNGWVAVYDELADRDPEARTRLARELSYGSGAVTLAFGVEQGAVVRYTLFEAGRAVDEYLSVPEFYESLPPGIVISLHANPTVVARLTGADPGQVRAVVRTADSAGELPPAPELAAQISAVMGIEGADRGWIPSPA